MFEAYPEEFLQSQAGEAERDLKFRIGADWINRLLISGGFYGRVDAAS